MLAAGDLLDTLQIGTPQSHAHTGSAVAVEGGQSLVGSPLLEVTANGWTSSGGGVALFDLATGNRRLQVLNPAPDILDRFGDSVALGGDYFAVGTPGNDEGAEDAGAVYVYDRSSGELLYSLINPEPTSYGQFGQSLAIAGDWLFIGSTALGKVRVVNLETGAFSGTISDPTSDNNGQFGSALAAHGDYLIVGEPFSSTAAEFAGAAHLFSATSQSFIGSVFDPTPSRSSRFGAAVAVSANRLVVGEPGEYLGSTSDVGQAYLFDLQSRSIVQTLVKEGNRSNNDAFGRSVAISNDFLFVGTQSGSVHQYTASNGTHVRTLTSPLPNSINRFGNAIGVSEGYVVIGAPGTTVESGAYQGAAFIGSESTGVLTDLPNAFPRDFDYTGTFRKIAKHGSKLLNVIPRESVYARERVELFQIGRHKPLHTFFDSEGSDNDYGRAIAMNDSTIAISSALNGGTVFLYDADTYEFIDSIVAPGPEAQNFGLTLVLEGDRLGIWSQHGIYVYDVATGNQLHFFPRTGTFAMSDSQIAIVERLPDRLNYQVSIYSLETGDQLSSFQGPLHSGDTQFAPAKVQWWNENLVIGGYSRRIYVLDVAQQQLVRIFEVGDSGNFPPPFDVQGNRLLIGETAENVAKLFDLPSGALRHTFTSPQPTNPQSLFGAAVLIDDEHLIVTAPGFRVALESEGAAFIYETFANDLTVIEPGDSVEYDELASPVFVAPAATVADIDPAYSGGTFNITLHGLASDILALVPGGDSGSEIGINGNEISYGGVPVATFTASGSHTKVLALTLNENATPEAIQAIIRRITFATPGDDPSPQPRYVQFRLVESDGTVSAPAEVVVRVVPYSAAPSIGFTDGITFTEGESPKLIDAEATIGDVDSPSFESGSITLRFLSGFTSEDRFTLQHQGTGPGQVWIAPQNEQFSYINYGGRRIGNVVFRPLSGATITFTAETTPEIAQAVLRRVQYRNDSQGPVGGVRTALIRVTDGDGGVVEQTFTIQVVPSNDAPTDIRPLTSFFYENAPPELNVIPLATTDPDLGDEFFYELVPGQGSDDNHLFSLYGNTLVPKVVFNTEEQFYRYVRIRTTDLQGLSFERSLQIAVHNTDDPPTNVRLTRSSVNENLPAGSAVGKFAYKDEDGDLYQFQLYSQLPNDNAHFVIVDNVLRTKSSFNFENKSSYTIYVSRSRTGGVEAFEAYTIYVENTNDAPKLDVLPEVTLGSIDEDATNPLGVYVEQWVAGQSDEDSAALKGIAVTNLSPPTNGTWQFSSDAGETWNDFPAIETGKTLLLAANGNTKIRFVPAKDFNGTVRLWYRAWDQTSGASGNVVNLSGNVGGIKSIGTEVEVATLTVRAVNDPPVLKGIAGSIGYTLGGPAKAVVPVATVTDVDSANFNGGVLLVQITSGAAEGNELAIGGSFRVTTLGYVRLGDTTIGRVTSNGLGLNDLAITLNANATAETTQQLFRAITFRSSSPAGARTLSFSLSDGDGSTSAVKTKLVNVVEPA